MNNWSWRSLQLLMPCLLSVLLAGCSSTKMGDPVNPKNPFVFPGQTPTATAAGTQPEVAPAPAPAPMPAPAPAAAPLPIHEPVVAPVSAVQIEAAPQPVQPTQRTTAPEATAISKPAPTTANPMPAGAGPAKTGHDTAVLRPGDNLVISFSDLPANNPLLPVTTELGEDGLITVHHNIRVNALGKTARALEQEIRAKLVPQYYQYLTVTVRTEMRFIHVSGEVKMPGQYPWRGDTTVLRCIGQAGWFTDWARQTQVQLTRANGTKAILNCAKAQKGDPKDDLPVYPGDYINVPRRGWWGW